MPAVALHIRAGLGVVSCNRRRLQAQAINLRKVQRLTLTSQMLQNCNTPLTCTLKLVPNPCIKRISNHSNAVHKPHTKAHMIPS